MIFYWKWIVVHCHRRRVERILRLDDRPAYAMVEREAIGSNDELLYVFHVGFFAQYIASTIYAYIINAMLYMMNMFEVNKHSPILWTRKHSKHIFARMVGTFTAYARTHMNKIAYFMVDFSIWPRRSFYRKDSRIYRAQYTKC